MFLENMFLKIQTKFNWLSGLSTNNHDHQTVATARGTYERHEMEGNKQAALATKEALVQQ